MKKNIAIIGSGFSSLSAACYLAKAGHNVTIYEKNDALGGRARQFKAAGFTFDMGPSWYWMPDVFDKFFNDFGKKVSDYFTLTKLSPAYRVYFGKDDFIDIEDTPEKICKKFESIEKGSGEKLKKYLKIAKENYEIGVTDMLYKMPGNSPLELVSKKTIKRVRFFLSNIRKDVRRDFKNPKLRSILEFPVLFLGAKASNTPAFYNFMNYADFGIGTFQPPNGFHDLVNAMVDLGKSLGVKYKVNHELSKINVSNKKVENIVINGKSTDCDLILSGADYHHTESLLPVKSRQYNNRYWKSRVFAPSSLLFYVGFNKKLKNVQHHNLIFDTDFNKHAEEIYDEPKWPSDPLFYANFTSKTNSKTAPEGSENAFFLIPIAIDLIDNEETRNNYFEKIISKMELYTGQELKNSITFKRSFCVNDFKSEYNSYGGNAYGLANTLFQTAFLRPNIKSKLVQNLYFCGQLTVPGPGVPPAIVSGELVANLINK
ncbi:MAG: phytoene desaturase family protein [Flavobacteriaceae bacterium]